MLLFGLLGITPALAQEREITGKVTDSKGESIPGVAVLVVETQQGNATDIDGNFKVKASTGNTLRFSYVNFKTQEVKVADATTINVTLEEDNLLEEIVVSSYRSLEREKFTGSITSVSTKVIEQVPIGSFDQILQGRAAGVMVAASSGRPGAGANVRIRGTSSISSPIDPLYILDGVPIAPADFAALNPNDFESVNVLKDAAATAIYGSRAGNGVIVITTKKGKAGQMKITYRGQFGINTRTSDRFDMMNTEEKIRFEKIVAQQGLIRGKAGSIQSNPALTQAQKDAQIDALSQINTDWPSLFFRASEQQSHELNFSGGTEKVQFYTAGNFRREDGILIRTGIERYNLRTNVNYKITDRLRGGVNITVGTTNDNRITEVGNNLNNPVLMAFVANPYESPYNPDGSYAAGVNATPAIPALGIAASPGTINLYHIQNEDLVTRPRTQIKVVGSTFVEYDIQQIKGLTYKGSLGLDYTQDQTNLHVKPQSPNQAGISGGSGLINRSYFRDHTIVATNTLRYNRTISDKHNVSAIAGNEVIQREFFTMNGQGFNLNPQFPFPVNGNGTTATIFTNRETKNSLVSYFLDLAYSFDNKYNVSASVRRDGSSRFGADKRYATFWSVGGAWNIHNEKFYETLGSLSTIISSANLRASYGSTGNQEVLFNTNDFVAATATNAPGGNFQSLTTYGGAGNYNNVPTLVPLTQGNPDFQWEQSNTFNVGLDLGILKNRIKFTVEYYNRLTSKLFIPTAISRTTGFPSLTFNTGEMRNQGIELLIDADVLKVGSFVWNVNINATYNKNRVEFLGEGVKEILDANDNIIRVGLPIKQHYLVKWAGVNPADGSALYRDLEGNIATFSGNYRDAQGTFEPPMFGGFTNRFTYKNLELSAFFSWARGFQLFNNNRFFTENIQAAGLLGHSNMTRSMLNIWTTPGQITNIPRANEPSQFETTRYLEPGDFIRLRNLTLSYNITGDYLKNMKISSARVYFQAQNLFTLTRFSGFDPEVTGEDSIGAPDTALSGYPVPRVYMMGVDISF